MGRTDNNQITDGVWLLSQDTFSFLDKFRERTRKGASVFYVLVAAISVHGGPSSNKGAGGKHVTVPTMSTNPSVQNDMTRGPSRERSLQDPHFRVRKPTFFSVIVSYVSVFVVVVAALVAPYCSSRRSRRWACPGLSVPLSLSPPSVSVHHTFPPSQLHSSTSAWKNLHLTP